MSSGVKQEMTDKDFEKIGRSTYYAVKSLNDSYEKNFLVRFTYWINMQKFAVRIGGLAIFSAILFFGINLYSKISSEFVQIAIAPLILTIMFALFVISAVSIFDAKGIDEKARKKHGN